jgi:hypothetical protein
MALRHRTQAECKGRKVDPWQEPTSTSQQQPPELVVLFSKYLPIFDYQFFGFYGSKETLFCTNYGAPQPALGVCVLDSTGPPTIPHPRQKSYMSGARLLVFTNE